MAREAGILSIVQNGSEKCELAMGSSFVSVRIPLRVEGEGERGDAIFHYSVGAFCGRDTALPIWTGLETTLRFRIPKEFFRSGELFTVEVLAESLAGTWKVLWAKHWKVGWPNKAPALDPVVD